MDDLIERTLEHRADEAQLRETSPGAIRERAQRLRHRRRSTASGILAGIAAVGVVVAISAGLTRVPAAGPAARDDSSHIVTSLSTVRQGLAPGIGYAVGTSFHLADGSVVRAPVESYGSWLPYAGGLLVTDAGQTGDLIHYDADGQAVDRYRLGSLAVSNDGHQVAWSDLLGVQVARVDGSHVRRTTEVNVQGVAGFLPGGSVVINAYGPMIVSQGETRPLPGLTSATATSQSLGLVAGTRSDNRTNAVVDTSGHVLWTTELQLRSFSSADGRHVVGVTAGTGSAPAVSILDSRSGDVTASLRFPASSHLVVDAVAWEDASRLLVLTVNTATREQSVLRLDYLGGVDRATDITTTREPFVFARTP